MIIFPYPSYDVLIRPFDCLLLERERLLVVSSTWEDIGKRPPVPLTSFLKL